MPPSAGPPSAVEARATEQPSLADQVIAEVVPPDVDWVGLVRGYPLTSLAVAATAGFLLGHRHGAALLRGVADAVTDRLQRGVERVVQDLTP